MKLFRYLILALVIFTLGCSSSNKFSHLSINLIGKDHEIAKAEIKFISLSKDHDKFLKTYEKKMVNTIKNSSGVLKSFSAINSLKIEFAFIGKERTNERSECFDTILKFLEIDSSNSERYSAWISLNNVLGSINTKNLNINPTSVFAEYEKAILKRNFDNVSCIILSKLAKPTLKDFLLAVKEKESDIDIKNFANKLIDKL